MANPCLPSYRIPQDAMGTILDLENPDPEGLKPLDVHRMILHGMVDDVPENNAN